MRLHTTLPALVLAITSAIFGVPRAQADGLAAAHIRVLTHNVMLMNPIAGDFGNATRADLIAEADYVRGYDVVAFQEAFDNGPVDRLTARLRPEYPFQTPVLGRGTAGWDESTGPLLWPLRPEDGGVAVLSKWPILQQVQHIYDIGCGFDALAAKGFVYVQLNVRGKRVHVVASHTQADDSLCIFRSPAQIRAAQFAAIDRFLDARRIPADEQVIIMGDLNVVRSSPEYASMLSVLDSVAPTSYGGSTTSFDPETNSLAAARYPGEPGQDLDYVLQRRTNQSPGAWPNRVLAAKAPAWNLGDVTYHDYSDHYPLAGG
ncbi:sphingomyelin phosphodiesterase [Nocardioides humilatus]|uniref:Sphingomyelin phosphodiesterase n=1 Tax=Nocardioides humilatus TaxID=2607660 RepID=A0A5B1L710_9ACTN|nr:sphingomyelin phosphodiesterase [Nocardioides humilatus]KAA1415958.1 sphingomyelin phosphodiesterase [Nocardioides humilatus]